MESKRILDLHYFWIKLFDPKLFYIGPTKFEASGSDGFFWVSLRFFEVTFRVMS